MTWAYLSQDLAKKFRFFQDPCACAHKREREREIVQTSNWPFQLPTLLSVQMNAAVPMGMFSKAKGFSMGSLDSNWKLHAETLIAPFRAMLSMFEITLGNWPPVARLLQDSDSKSYRLRDVAATACCAKRQTHRLQLDSGSLCCVMNQETDCSAVHCSTVFITVSLEHIWTSIFLFRLPTMFCPTQSWNFWFRRRWVPGWWSLALGTRSYLVPCSKKECKERARKVGSRWCTFESFDEIRKW